MAACCPNVVALGPFKLGVSSGMGTTAEIREARVFAVKSASRRRLVAYIGQLAKLESIS